MDKDTCYRSDRDEVLPPGRRGAEPEAFLKSESGPFEVVLSGKAAGNLLCSLSPPSSGAVGGGGGRAPLLASWGPATAAEPYRIHTQPAWAGVAGQTHTNPSWEGKLHLDKEIESDNHGPVFTKFSRQAGSVSSRDTRPT